jgi:hypothetical protein
MMGGTSQHALANIGAGAQQGVANLMQSNKLRTAEENAILQGRLGQERYKGTEAYRNAQLEESKLRREGIERDRTGASILGFEKAARGQAITLLGSKLDVMKTDEEKERAINQMTQRVLAQSNPYQMQLRKLQGENYMEPQVPAAGGATFSYDPTKRTLSGR